ncbi:polyprenyl diphosphate synthase [Dehalococcoidales bacterium]|nr:polyprenyl diphosphate synthase [Dehalococcoidales bacterium]
MIAISRLPNHIAIVPDGNGRWAEQQGLPRLEGHRVGVEVLGTIIEYLNHYQIKYVTIYTLSTENWKRPQDEIRGLFRLSMEMIDKNLLKLHKKGVRLRHLGRLEGLPSELKQAINEAVELTKNNTGMTLSFAFNYGGRAEILEAVRRLVAEGISPQNIDEKLFNSYLYTAGLPDVDLLIRTGDELRLSNFLIWQTAYSEYYFTEVPWPEFGKKDIDQALLSYSQRQRRFGGL